MDNKRTTLGFILIFGLLYAYTLLNKPTEAELKQLEAKKQAAMVDDTSVQSIPIADRTNDTMARSETTTMVSDSLEHLLNRRQYGSFARHATGSSKIVKLSNDQVEVSLDTKGGKIVQVVLKNHHKVAEVAGTKKEIKEPLLLLANEKDVFSYTIPMRSLPNGLSTDNLYFEIESVSENRVVFSCLADDGARFTQTYTLEDGYKIEYDIALENASQLIDDSKDVKLEWQTYLDKLEKNDSYERRMSTVYFKEASKTVDHCNCTKSDEEQMAYKPIKWASHANQFFNATLMAEGQFSGGSFSTVELEKNAKELKLVKSSLDIPINELSNGSFGMSIYVGPNEFDRLQDLGYGLYNIIPFGSNIFGSINQWVVRPIFNFLNNIFGNKGLSIIVLTLLIKLLVFPLTYRSLLSSSKMQALKPEMDRLKEKFKEDTQKIQMETMKLYQEFGVNPAGGCFPMLLQMPIWFAIFRFFPASIQFRQEPFLWATDLSSYDVFFRLPSEVPGFGGHISLFALLWAISSVIYSVYNMKNMNTSQMSDQMKPMMYMQYFMPIMFFFVFNNYASGLSCYFFFSNLFNILQTMVTKNYLIDHDKIRAQLERNKTKPKKKSGFQERLQKALAEQQKIAEEKQKSGKKK